jgi:hypothetical protein
MAFTLEVLEEAMAGSTDAVSSYYKFDQNPNRKIVFDYLIGESDTLHGLTASQYNHPFSFLLKLIHGLESLNENDKLVLNVITHQKLFPAVEYALWNWIAVELVSKDSESVIKGAIHIAQQLQISRSELSLHLLYHLYYINDAYSLIQHEGSALKEFLLQNLPSLSAYNLRYGNTNTRGNRNPIYFKFTQAGYWNPIYFRLLEKAMPDQAETYLLQGLATPDDNQLGEIAEYVSVSYTRSVKRWMRSTSTHPSQLVLKYITAIALQESDAGLFTDLRQEVAEVYLKSYDDFYNKDSWEPGRKVALLNNDSKFWPYSSIAIHDVLQYNPTLAKAVVADWLKNKAHVRLQVFVVLAGLLKEEALPLLATGLKPVANTGGNEFYQGMITLLTENYSPEKYLPVLWNLAATKSRQVRETIARIIIDNDAEAEDKAIALLANKNAEARQTGAFMLSSFNSAKSIAAVGKLLDSETNDNARDAFLEIVKDQLTEPTPDSLITSARNRKKLSAPLETWLNESDLPPLFHLNGETVLPEELRFLFYRMSRLKTMRSDSEANILLRSIDKNRSINFATEVIDRYQNNGTRPEQKYLLALIALMGNEEVVDLLRHLTDRWIDDSRWKMAEYGVAALALQGSNKALRWVEWYSRKYKSKKANIGAAALQALNDAAEEQGITIHELGDRVVPDFGFDGLYRTFQVDGDEYRAFIDGKFKICYFDEDGKQLKTLPSGASAELKEEFKQLAKEVRDVVKSQSGRMEHYLLIRRKWNAKNWKDFFLANPVMFIYATKILWGIYDAEQRLIDCFICQEDGSLVDVQEQEVDIPAEHFAGIVHPLELSAEQLKTWKRKFFDLAIEPVFPQLDRLIFRVAEAEAGNKIITDFSGKNTQVNSIRNVLEKFNWRAVGSDGGIVDAFHLTETNQGIIAVLDVEGVAVFFDAKAEPRMGKLYFLDKKKQVNKWIDSPTNETDKRLIAIGDLPPVFYSEVMYNLHSIQIKPIV